MIGDKVRQSQRIPGPNGAVPLLLAAKDPFIRKTTQTHIALQGGGIAHH